MSDVKTIYQPWGGLGDNLAHSIIPELCNIAGYKCFLSKNNAYRNEQIYDLIWKANPFLEKEQPDTHDLSWLDRCGEYENKGLNHVQVIQKTYGFNTSFEYPKIYYTPKFLPEYKNSTFIDFNSISVGYDKDILQNKLRQLMIENKMHDNVFIVTHSKIDNTQYKLDFATEIIDINDLFFYSDIVYSCKNIIKLNSGMTNLASTIKNQFQNDTQIYTLTYRKYLKESGSNGYFYSNNNYITVD